MNFFERQDQILKGMRIGLGLAAIGRPAYINLGHDTDLKGKQSVEALKNHAHQVLDAAFAGGVRYFDAARSYGKAEEFLKKWLQKSRHSTEEVVIGSKWGYTYVAGWRLDVKVHEVKEHSLANFRKQWAESRENLGDYLKLYQIHSATLESGVLNKVEILDALAALKEKDVAVGLTVSGSRQREVIEKAIEARVDGLPLFDTIQATWNLLEQSCTAALWGAHNAGIGVMIKEALANGRLTDKNTHLDFCEQMNFLKEEAARFSTSIDALAIAAALAQPWADIVLSGAATADQLQSNLKALDVEWDEQAAEHLDHIRESPSTYWSKRDELEWK